MRKRLLLCLLSVVAACAASDVWEAETEPDQIDLTLPAQTPAQLVAFEFPPGLRPGNKLRLENPWDASRSLWMSASFQENSMRSSLLPLPSRSVSTLRRDCSRPSNASSTTSDRSPCFSSRPCFCSHSFQPPTPKSPRRKLLDDHLLPLRDLLRPRRPHQV
jgi:hypothetical protein